MKITGKDIENKLVNDFEVLVTNDNKDYYIQFFINSDDDYEYNLYKKSSIKNIYYQSDGGSYQSLDGIEEDYNMDRYVDFSFDVYNLTLIEQKRDIVMKYASYDENKNILDYGYTSINKDLYNYINDENIGINIQIYLDCTTQSLEKIALNEVSPLLRNIAKNMEDFGWSYKIYLEDCIRRNITDINLWHLYEECEELGLSNYIEINQTGGIDNDPVITVYPDFALKIDYTELFDQEVYDEMHLGI
ncbi:MAG: hypothetical protein LUG60_06025 [Erysipelotrichaceae bacterium]|nr:hypothetical protein [Erysipelotrichaceae bacterium]